MNESEFVFNLIIIISITIILFVIQTIVFKIIEKKKNKIKNNKK